MKKILTIKTLYGFLIVSFISSSVFLYFFTLIIDEKYTDLIATETRISELTQTISKRSNNGYFMLAKMLHETDKNNIRLLKKTCLDQRIQNDHTIDSLSKVAFSSTKSKQSLQYLISCRKTYINHCNAFYETKENGNNKPAIEYFADSLSPAFIAYQNELEVFLKKNNKHLLEASNQISTETKTKSFIYLALGLSPFAIFGIFTVLSFLFMLIFFKIFFYEESH
jgi:hypothetical protein